MSKKKILKALEIPEEIGSNVTGINISGFSKIRIENYKSLVEYEKERIRINTSEALICIEGNGFNISSVTDTIVEIEGKISAVYFE